MAMTLANSLPILIGELIKRMNEKEKIELSKQFTWEELEEWKATADVLSDKKLMKKIKQGLTDEKTGKIKSADNIFRK